LPGTLKNNRSPLTIWRKRILIQEAAIKQLNERIQALESQVSQLQAAKPSSGGFLSGLFGGGQSRGSDPIPGAEQYGRPQASVQPQYAPQTQQQSYAPQGARSGGGFMAGALQTAAGVAGGVVLGNMLTNMFSGSHPQEIVNIIEGNRSRISARRRTIASLTIPSARMTVSSLPTTTTMMPTSTPVLATMISAATTTAGFNPAGA
jgi:Uncharacterized protein conserved in bacteria